MEKTNAFLANWLVVSLIFTYYHINNNGNIGYTELTSILIGTLIGTIIYRLIKSFVTKKLNNM